MLCLGEPSNLSGECRSRAFLRLPGAQEELLQRLSELGKPIVLVVFAGRRTGRPPLSDFKGISSGTPLNPKGTDCSCLDLEISPELEFRLSSEELGFYDADERFVTEPGRFRVFVGGDSRASLAADFELY